MDTSESKRLSAKQAGNRAGEALQESEEKLDSMMRSIADHMSMMDKDLNIIWANETARKIFGHGIIGEKCYKIYHGRKEPCEPYPCLTLKAFQDGKVHEHDTKVIDQDGEIIYFHRTANVALKNNEGKPTAVIAISRDITKRKRAEEALREAKALLDKTFASLDQAVFIVDAATRTIVKCNPAVGYIFGYSEEEVGGRNTEFLHVNRDMYEKFGRELFPALDKSGVYHTEFQMRRKDGSVFFSEYTVTEIVDDSGQRTSTVSVVRDITRRKQAEEALKKKERKLEQQAQHLEEVNTALKVLLEHREEEKRKLEESILMNVRKLVSPYIEKLDKGRIEGENKTYLSIITSNLENLVSPFANKLSSKYLNFTLTEIQVADFVKHGQTSKEIASMLRVSPNGVMFHRKNIRKKLGLANKKVNLRAYLHSLSK